MTMRDEGLVPAKASLWVVDPPTHVRHLLSCQWCGQRRADFLRRKTQEGSELRCVDTRKGQAHQATEASGRTPSGHAQLAALRHARAHIPHRAHTAGVARRRPCNSRVRGDRGSRNPHPQQQARPLARLRAHAPCGVRVGELLRTTLSRRLFAPPARAARSRRPLVPPARAARLRRPLAPSAHVATSLRRHQTLMVNLDPPQYRPFRTPSLRATLSHRPLAPPARAVHSRRPFAPPARAARSSRPLVPPLRAARSRRPLAPSAHAAASHHRRRTLVVSLGLPIPSHLHTITSRHPLAPPASAARLHRPPTPPARAARLRRPLEPPACVRHAALLALRRFGDAPDVGDARQG